jgi:hypothetical protein
MKAVLTALLILVVGSAIAGRTAGSEGSGETDRDGAVGNGDERTPRRENDRGFFGRSRCSIAADAPSRDRRNNRIVGTASYLCDRPGGDVEFTVYLQRRGPGNAWTSIDSRQVAANGGATTRSKSQRQRTQSVIGPCLDGVYRTFLRGTVTVDGRSEVVEKVSKTVTDPCPRAGPT